MQESFREQFNVKPVLMTAIYSGSHSVAFEGRFDGMRISLVQE